MNPDDRHEDEPLERLAAAANRGDARALERLVRSCWSGQRYHLRTGTSVDLDLRRLGR
jgi:hypothetical protein